jgi:hypothetical protein
MRQYALLELDIAANMWCAKLINEKEIPNWKRTPAFEYVNRMAADGWRVVGVGGSIGQLIWLERDTGSL